MDRMERIKQMIDNMSESEKQNHLKRIFIGELSNQEISDLLTALAFSTIAEGCIGDDESFAKRGRAILNKFADIGGKISRENLYFYPSPEGFENEEDQNLIRKLDCKIETI